MLEAFLQHLPEIGKLIQAGVEPLLQRYESLPSVSIDYGIIQRASKMAVKPLDAGWMDLGSWDGFYGMGKKDKKGNVVFGDALLENCSNCLLKGNGR